MTTPSLSDWSRNNARLHGDAEAVVDLAGGRARRYSHAELDERANRLATWLARRGVGAGHRVAVLARNRIEILDALFACAKLGAVLVPYNWRLHENEVTALVRKIPPKVVLFADEQAGLAKAVVDASGALAVGLDGDDTGLDGATYRAIQAAPTRCRDYPTHDPETIACLLFTGGTTGLPKAARISHRMIAWNLANTVIHELRPDDATVVHLPMFHAGGLLVYTLPLLALGGRVVLTDRWDPGQLLWLIPREKITLLVCVPSQYHDLVGDIRFAGADLSSLRFVTSGGAPLPPDLRDRFLRHHPGIPFKQGFGMTEAGPGLFSMSIADAGERFGSIGKPNYFVEAELLRTDGTLVAVGEVGELAVRGPVLFSGYQLGADADACELPLDDDGWFRTGDLAHRDADGFYYVDGRRKEMYISGGENVYPAEIEAVLRRHPAVADCAVVGISDSRWGEIGCAHVVLEGWSSATRAELADFLRAHLARYKVPRAFVFTDTLPRSAAGKLLRDQLVMPEFARAG